MGRKTGENKTAERNVWKFNINLGEMAHDIINLNENILVLGEKNIFCFNLKGSLKLMIHLGYSVCFHGY